MCRLRRCIDLTSISRCCEESGAAFLLNPLANLRPVELEDVAAAAAACLMDGSDMLQRLLDELFAQQFAERIEDDAVADAEEEMERSGNDALWVDGEERRVVWVQGMAIARSAVARGGSEAFVRDDADGTGMSGGRSHEAQYCIDEGPVAIEEG